MGFSSFLRKYFWEGQQLNTKAATQDADPNAPWHTRHRKLISIGVPIAVVWTFWFTFMALGGYEPGPDGTSFHLFTADSPVETGSALGKPRWYMSITMIFGALVAGSTSEGGAAIAFPVMTLALGIPPPIARDFSFMIQSVGMVAAAFTIIYMKVQVEWKSIIYTSMGGILGIFTSLEFIAPLISPAYNKMYFVVVWSAFAFSLFYLNRLHGRKTYATIPDWEGGVLWRSSTHPDTVNFNWKCLTLLGLGVVGGIFSGLAGSGIDICSFAVLTLLFRVSEKTATPTSVVIMGINTVLGFLYRQYGMGGVKPEAWGYLLVCMPIVVVCAPLGSIVGSHFHRLTLAAMIYVIDAAQLAGALYVVRPWLSAADGGKTDTPAILCATSVAMFVFWALVFSSLAKVGIRVMAAVERNLAAAKDPEAAKGDATDGEATELVAKPSPTDVPTATEEVALVV